jgi:hypothetical protein
MTSPKRRAVADGQGALREVIGRSKGASGEVERD